MVWAYAWSTEQLVLKTYLYWLSQDSILIKKNMPREGEESLIEKQLNVNNKFTLKDTWWSFLSYWSTKKKKNNHLIHGAASENFISYRTVWKSHFSVLSSRYKEINSERRDKLKATGLCRSPCWLPQNDNQREWRWLKRNIDKIVIHS